MRECYNNIFVYVCLDHGLKSIAFFQVTGAANGVGKELALLLGQEGCNVICWDVEEVYFWFKYDGFAFSLAYKFVQNLFLL